MFQVVAVAGKKITMSGREDGELLEAGGSGKVTEKVTLQMRPEAEGVSMARQGQQRSRQRDQQLERLW